jgi:hypothetical protein
MKKILVAGIALLIVFLADGSALAWHRHSHFDVGVFIRPPIILAPPPMIIYHGYYPPPYGYYDYDYYYGRHRVWVPGYWDRRWTPSGWGRVWVPGYRGWR